MTTATEIRSLDLMLVRKSDGTTFDLAVFQDMWTEAQYLTFTNQTNRLIEFTDGVIEELPMPTDTHQVLSRFLLFSFFAFIRPLGGEILYAPLRIRIREGKFREPDLLLIRDAHNPRRQNRFWLGADLVVEIVSPDDPERDTVDKRADYAEVGIPEYWIVNPEEQTISVLTLTGDAYSEHGVFRRGTQATSALLDASA